SGTSGGGGLAANPSPGAPGGATLPPWERDTAGCSASALASGVPSPAPRERVPSPSEAGEGRRNAEGRRSEDRRPSPTTPALPIRPGSAPAGDVAVGGHLRVPDREEDSRVDPEVRGRDPGGGRDPEAELVVQAGVLEEEVHPPRVL